MSCSTSVKPKTARPRRRPNSTRCGCSPSISGTGRPAEIARLAAKATTTIATAQYGKGLSAMPDTRRAIALQQAAHEQKPRRVAQCVSRRSKRAMSQATPTARRPSLRPPRPQWQPSPHTATPRVGWESIQPGCGWQMQGIPPRQGRNSRQRRWRRCFRSRVESFSGWKWPTLALLRCRRKSPARFDAVGEDCTGGKLPVPGHAAQRSTSTVQNRASRASHNLSVPPLPA